MTRPNANNGDFRHLGYDADGVKEDFNLNEETGEITIARTFLGEMNPHFQIEKNKQELRDNPKNQTKDKSFRKVASIPLWVQARWIEIYGVDPLLKGNEALLTRLLNDPDWKWVRTSEGRVKIREH